MKRLPAALSAAALALTLAGCGSSSSDSTPQDAGDSTDVSGTPSPTPTDSSTETTVPSPSSTDPMDPVPAGTDNGLLSAGELPGLNASYHWQKGETFAPAPAKPFGVCAKFDSASIGADKVIERTYFPPKDTDDNAAQQVLTFVDATNTQRAAAVIRAWMKDCATRIPEATNAKIGPLTQVSIPGGQGAWYLASWQPKDSQGDEGRFEAFGTATKGTSIALIRMTTGGQDYNYPAGREPIAKAVTFAGAKLP